MLVLVVLPQEIEYAVRLCYISVLGPVQGTVPLPAVTLGGLGHSKLPPLAVKAYGSNVRLVTPYLWGLLTFGCESAIQSIEKKLTKEPATVCRLKRGKML